MSTTPRLVIVESPYAGAIDRNTQYARAALADSLRRGEAPFASHLLYTQPGVLDDTKPAEREQGIVAGFAWAQRADATVVYIDLGVSGGMIAGIDDALAAGRPIELRRVPGWATEPTAPADGSLVHLHAAVANLIGADLRACGSTYCHEIPEYPLAPTWLQCALTEPHHDHEVGGYSWSEALSGQVVQCRAEYHDPVRGTLRCAKNLAHNDRDEDPGWHTTDPTKPNRFQWSDAGLHASLDGYSRMIRHGNIDD